MLKQCKVYLWTQWRQVYYNKFKQELSYRKQIARNCAHDTVPFESMGIVSYSPSIVTMAISLAISQIFGTKAWPDFEIWVWGRSRSFEMARFDRPCSFFLLVRHGNYSSFLYHFRVSWRWIISWPKIWLRSHSRSLKLVPFESLGAVSYSPSIVTVAVYVAVCEIFSVKEWRNLENQVRGRSRSLKIAPF